MAIHMFAFLLTLLNMEKKEQNKEKNVVHVKILKGSDR